MTPLPPLPPAQPHPQTPPADLRPEMSAQEASWHEHLAGMRADDAARAMGADPAAVAAVANATSGSRQIGRHHLRPANQGTVWTLKRIAKDFSNYADAHHLPASEDEENPGEREMIELGLTCLVFSDARRVWNLLEAQRLHELVAESLILIWETPMEEQLALQAHFRSEMDTLARLSRAQDGTPEKKPQPAEETETWHGTSAGMQTPQPVPASPPSNGLPQNTQSPLKQPSGNSLSL